jgi:hypothetical protein
MENFVMALAELIWAGSLFFGSGGIYTITSLTQKKTQKRAAEPVEPVKPVKIDGRTQEEWYEILKGMTREQYEALSLGPLDGLVRNQDYGWDAKKLVGEYNYKWLMRGWYPERVCKNCSTFDCIDDHNKQFKKKSIASVKQAIKQYDYGYPYPDRLKCKFCYRDDHDTDSCPSYSRPVRKRDWDFDSHVGYFEDAGDIKYHVTKQAGTNLVTVEGARNGIVAISKFYKQDLEEEPITQMNQARAQIALALNSKKTTGDIQKEIDEVYKLLLNNKSSCDDDLEYFTKRGKTPLEY